MIELLSALNPDQRQVVEHRGHCLTIACPGSGKTKTLATKAAVLLDQGERVCAVTFTRDAALELRHRTISMARPGAKSRLLVGTFHSVSMLMACPGRKTEFGRSILADMQSPFTEPWNIVKEGVRIGYLNRAIKECGAKLSWKDATTLIEESKAVGSTELLEPEAKIMVEMYCALMKAAGQIDFQDIILKTNAALRDKTLSPLQVDHLLIDEYQDTDEAQYEWSRHHGRAGVALTVVGDDDQSIYAFRRALGYAGMDRFANEFGAMRVLLGTNYRCRSEILSAAERLISHNTERIGKSLVAEKGEGGVVSYESFRDAFTEYAAVAEEAAIACSDGATFAVIARTNDELTGLQAAMVTRGVPYRKTDGRSIFDCPEVQVYAAILRTIIKPNANDIDQALAWAGMSMDDTAEVRALFGSHVRIGSAEDFKGTQMSAKGIEVWRSFAKKHAAWTSHHDNGHLAIMNHGVWEWLDDTLQKPANPTILGVAQRMYEVTDGTLQAHLARLRESERNQKQTEQKEGDGEKALVAWLTTAHGSKGLEFDRVWVVGLQSGSFPSDKSSLEEERRLMYVAMTRAREVLNISATKEKKPSIFISEAGFTV